VCSQAENESAGHQRMQPKTFPESQNHGDWRESKLRRPLFPQPARNASSPNLVLYSVSDKRKAFARIGDRKVVHTAFGIGLICTITRAKGRLTFVGKPLSASIKALYTLSAWG